MIIDFDNHRGEFCWIRPMVFCQEGYCGGCQVYFDEKECPSCKANLEVWAEMGLGEHYHIKERVSGQVQ